MNDYVPLIYALIPNKEEGIRERFFRAVKTLAPAAQPRNVLTDFELAAMNALTTVFQTPNNDFTLSGCFYLNQNIGRVQSEGLKPRYEGEPAFALLLRHIPALAFVSAAQVLNAYTTLEQTLPNEMLQILYYFERTYIGRRIGADRRAPTYATEFWNVHEKVMNEDEQQSRRSS